MIDDFSTVIRPMNATELCDRLWNFAARIAKVVDALPDSRSGRHVAGQLIRCGTSAPPNYDEARVAESRADFSHKVNIACKELVETEGWLKFIVIATLLPSEKLHELRDECSQLCKILITSVATSRGRKFSTMKDVKSSMPNAQ
jgi:four helix bundle protein